MLRTPRRLRRQRGRSTRRSARGHRWERGGASEFPGRGVGAGCPGSRGCGGHRRGSTEFVVGRSDVEAAVSENVGCVRMTERHLRSDPPRRADRRGRRKDIDAAVARRLDGDAGSTGPTASSVWPVRSRRWRRWPLGLPEYDSLRIHGSRTSPLAGPRGSPLGLLEATRERRATEPVMHPGRVDVIGGGALVLDRILAARRVPRGHRQRTRHPGRDRAGTGGRRAVGCQTWHLWQSPSSVTIVPASSPMSPPLWLCGTRTWRTRP